MRLGDLDALKEDFKSRLADCNKWIEKAKDKETKIRASTVKAFICEVIMTINNAPTVPQVTVFAENASKEEIEDFKQELEKVLERPQGEWIYKKFDVESGIPRSYWCSNCGEPKSQLSDNFCACCGADMRGKEE